MAARALLGFTRSARITIQWRIAVLCDRTATYQLLNQFSNFSTSLTACSFGSGSSVREDWDGNRNTFCTSSFFSAQSIIFQQTGCHFLREAVSLATSSGQTVSLSSLALASREVETVQQAAEIGYEVLGQYVPEGARITPQAAFALVQVGSHQFKVSPGDMIYTEKLKYADINDKLLLSKVLLMGSLKQTIIGRPFIPEAGVLAAVEEIALDEKVIVFKKKRRKNYRRTNGHRQELTRLRILHIEGIEASSLADGAAVDLKDVTA